MQPGGAMGESREFSSREVAKTGLVLYYVFTR